MTKTAVRDAVKQVKPVLLEEEQSGGKAHLILEQLDELAELTVEMQRRQLAESRMLPEVLEGSFEAFFDADRPDGSKEQVRIKGVVDRLDTLYDEEEAAVYLRILDYKTGNKTIEFDDLYAGSSVQLPSYMHVYSSMHPELSPDGVSYIHVKRVKKSTKGISESFDPDVVARDHNTAVEETYLKNCELKADPEDMKRMGEFALSRVKEKCEELYGGHFDARPAKIKKHPLLRCGDCEYNQICNGNPESPDYNYLPTMEPKLNEQGKAMKKQELFFSTIKEKEE